MSNRKFYGKYRAQCVNNVDPDQTPRIQVIVSDVSDCYGGDTVWFFRPA